MSRMHEYQCNKCSSYFIIILHCLGKYKLLIQDGRLLTWVDQFVTFSHRTPMCSNLPQQWYKWPDLEFLGYIILVMINRTPDAGLLHSEPLSAFVSGVLYIADYLGRVNH